MEQRIKKGAEEEIKKLLEKGYTFTLPAFSALGYRQWKDYFNNKADLSKTIRKWKFAEHAYARRQLTWFKKDKEIVWFDIKQKNFRENIVKLVGQWYSEK